METLIVVIYLAAVLIVGMLAGRRMKGLEDFAVAGRSFGSLVIFATLSASFIGGGFSMGNAEKVFLVGISNIVALWGFSLKEVLVGLFIAPRLERYPDAISIGDIMEPHYGKSARIFSGVFGVVLCAGIMGAQVSAMGYIFNIFLGLDRLTGILVGCGIVIAYSTVGGMRAVIWTDVIQFVVLAVGIPLTLYFGISEAGGWESVAGTVPAGHLMLSSEPAGLLSLAALFITFMLGETLVPPYVQRLLIGRDTTEVSRGTILSGIFSVPFFAVTGLVGLVALAIDPNLNPNLAMPFVIRESLNPVMQGIMIAAVVSIIMSSADSFLNGAAISFSNDIFKPLYGKPMKPASELLVARIVTLLTGVLSILFALSIESVLDILIYAYGFWAPTVVPPLCAAILGFRTTAIRIMGGAVAGIVAVLVWNNLLHAPFGVDGLVVGSITNLLVFFAIPGGNGGRCSFSRR